jgi:hypothetical protein
MVVRGLEKIDEANRQVWFRASGMFRIRTRILFISAASTLTGAGSYG